MDRREAERNLRIIRSLMERATRHAAIPAAACFAAAVSAAAGAAFSAWRGMEFSEPEARDVLVVWLGVAAVSLAGFSGLTLAGARRRGEPCASRSTWAVLLGLAPALASGAVLTSVLGAPLWPGAWMLCYGTGVCSLGYFAGWRAVVIGALFLALGAGSLLLWRDRGLWMMGATFGGLHALFGGLLLVTPREEREAIALDAAEDR